MPSLIWLQGATDNGCAISFLNIDQPYAPQILTKLNWRRGPSHELQSQHMGRRLGDPRPFVKPAAGQPHDPAIRVDDDR